MTNSIKKGKAGEREFSNLCKNKGYDTRRGQQFSGINGDADVIGLSGIHIEVKRVEALNIEKAMAQAISDSKNTMPIVAHRKNGQKWLITMGADDWFKIYKGWLE